MQHIILVFADSQMANSTANVLNSAGIKVDGIFTSGTKALSYIVEVEKCLVISSFQLEDMSSLNFYEQLPLHCCMLLISKQYVDDCRSAGIITLVPPLNKSSFIKSVNMMLEKDIDWISSSDKRPNLSSEEKKIIEQAKQLLINNYNISEPQAHSFLQKRSMKNSEKLYDTARKIIDALST